MLCLTRRNGEAVVLRLPDGREVTVTLVAREGDRVRLGFAAPADVVIFREELREQFAQPRQA